MTKKPEITADSTAIHEAAIDKLPPRTQLFLYERDDELQALKQAKTNHADAVIASNMRRSMRDRLQPAIEVLALHDKSVGELVKALSEHIEPDPGRYGFSECPDDRTLKKYILEAQQKIDSTP